MAVIRTSHYVDTQDGITMEPGSANLYHIYNNCWRKYRDYLGVMTTEEIVKQAFFNWPSPMEEQLYQERKGATEMIYLCKCGHAEEDHYEDDALGAPCSIPECPCVDFEHLEEEEAPDALEIDDETPE